MVSIAVIGVSAAEESIIDVEKLSTVNSGEGWSYNAANNIITVTGDVTITGKNDDISICVGAENITLTLRDAELGNKTTVCACGGRYLDIICSSHYEYSFIINLEGENEVTSPDSQYPIYSNENITFTGEGKLEITCEGVPMFNDITVSGGKFVMNNYTGISCITITGGTLETKEGMITSEFNMSGGNYIGHAASEPTNSGYYHPALKVSGDLSISGGCFKAENSKGIVADEVGNISVVVSGVVEYADEVKLLSGEFVPFNFPVSSSSAPASSGPASSGPTSSSSSSSSIPSYDFIYGDGDIHLCDVHTEESNSESSSVISSKSESASSSSESKIEQNKNPNTNDMSFVFIGGIAVLAFAVAVITIKRKTIA